jgi:hypothetical protein
LLSSWSRSLDITTGVDWRSTADPKSHRAPRRQQTNSCRVRPIPPNTVQLECSRCTDWVLPVMYLYGSSDIIFLVRVRCKKNRRSHVILPALQIHSFVSAYFSGITSQSIHRIDTILLTQLHYIITHKVGSCHRASTSRFHIKFICI